MIVFTTLHNSSYECLADITCEKNKKIYCKKHNYPLVIKNGNWLPIPIGYEKAYLIKTAFNLYTDCEWVFFSESDTLITNMNIKLEDIIKDEQKHFIITTDVNGINAGSFFIRNSKEGNEYLNAMIQSIGHFQNEQEFIQNSYSNTNFKEIIHLYPQKSFNSYTYSKEDYPNYSENFNKGIDKLGNNGKWEIGDFIVHFVDKNLESRLALANTYINKVIND